MTTRVLFVDDDQAVLSGLQRRLRGFRDKWEMDFVQGGQVALDRLAASHYDVIVSDLRMPVMDGIALLEQVRARHPHLVRLILSGNAEFEQAMRAAPLAHQWLSKPCEPGALEAVIDRACHLRSLLNNEAVEQIIGRIERLPVSPRLYTQIAALLADEHVSLDDAARVLRQDMAVCAKLLQLVNSAFFGASRPIAQIDEALMHLGLGTIQRIVLGIELFSGDHKLGPQLPARFLDELQRHAVATGCIASSLMDTKQQKEGAFVAGLLHDIGKLVLAMLSPDRLARAGAVMDDAANPMYSVETALYGTSHAEVGAYLLGIWGLPEFIIEAVANHHQPARVPHAAFGVLTAVHIADALANESLGMPSDAAGHAQVTIDMAYVASLGLAGRLDEWRQLARDGVGEFAAGVPTSGR